MQDRDKLFDLLKNVKLTSRITGIGSVPFTDIDEACGRILRYCPHIPYIPQFTKLDFKENMFAQFSENLPCIKVDYEKKRILYDEGIDRAAKLAEFYDYVGYNCYEYFKISHDFSRGFYAMLKACEKTHNVFIKTQITGPITYLLAVANSGKQSIIYDAELADAITLGLGMKGLWQAKEIQKIGKIPIIFYDEPSLWGLGSAYMPLGSDKARSFIDNLTNFIKERDRNVLVGLHCCGNTDWEMILESNIDIVSFDAYGFGDKVALYPGEIKHFLEKGGLIAFGIVPTSEYRDDITDEYLYECFLEVLESLERKRIDRSILLKSALFTPACGMGPLPEASARRIMELTTQVVRKIENKYVTI